MPETIDPPELNINSDEFLAYLSGLSYDDSLVSPNSNATPVPTDHAFDQEDLGRFDQWSIEKLKERDELYSSMLSGYEAYVKTVLTSNLVRQEHFYEISMIVLLLSPIQFVVCLSYCMQHLPDVTAIVTLLTSITEVLGVLLVIPQIIAKYLFNTGETTSINSIVSAIQTYDIEIRKGIRSTANNKPHIKTSE